MKVTVCFGNIRVVVPCGDGDLLVSELIEKAILRYKKATGKFNQYQNGVKTAKRTGAAAIIYNKSPKDYWVAVHNLKAADGGILDSDDQLADVADDREQIIALYEEQGGPPLHHNGGDGTSASSVGTSSPDMFHSSDLGDKHPQGFRPYIRDGGKNDVIITQNDLQTGSTLIVRRGSEPVLTSVGHSSTEKKRPDLYDRSPNKRWSAIADFDDSKIPQESNENVHRHHSPNERPPPYPQRSEGIGQEREGDAREGEPDDLDHGSISSFARDSTRRSLANNTAMWKWLEAQENQQERLQNTDRKEPLGGTGDPEEKDLYLDSEGEIVSLKNTGGPLGIHVVPEYDDMGRELGGLVLQGIEPGGRVYQDGRIKVLDRIIEINGRSLRNMEFRMAQELFKKALGTDELRLRVLKTQVPPPLPKQPPPLTLPTRTFSDSSADVVSSAENASKSPPDSPSKKTPPPLPVRHPSTHLTNQSSQGKGTIIAPTNTKRIGKKINITLPKGSKGLGFSVTTRDNPAGGVPPIYIKNILPKGAAIEDGRLKSGDRLLEINDKDVSGMSQSDVVSLLRTTKVGMVVNLVVSRIGEVEDKFVPRELSSNPSSTTNSPIRSTPSSPSHDALQPPDKSGDDGSLLAQEKELMPFDIALNDSGSAGLGVSVKGKTTLEEKPHDLGIFIKAIINGGAASKDGRLMVNDQLIEVNGNSLQGKSNTAAMETLRKAMQRDGPISGKIHLLIARRKGGHMLQNSLNTSTPSREFRISNSDHPDGLASLNTSEKSMNQSLNSIIKDTVKSNITDSNANKRDYVDLNSKDSSSKIGMLMSKSTEGLRNTSYHQATNESMMDSSSLNGEVMDKNQDPVNLRQQNGANKVRPASTIGFQWQDPHYSNLTHKSSVSNDDLLEHELKSKWDNNPDVLQDDIPAEGSDGGFSREGFGRQSMSEKRKGHLDPRSSEFYQKVKDLREKGKDDKYYSATWDPRKSKLVYEGTLKRANSAESLLGTAFNHQEPCDVHERFPYPRPPIYINPFTGKPSSKDLGPTLGLKKSSSLESLQTAVQEVVLEDDIKNETGFYRPPNMNRGMIRGRGCNESFRAAVDRSYDNQPSEPMETLATTTISVEEEAESETGSSLGKANSQLSGSFNNGGVADTATTGSGQGDENVGEKKKRKNSRKEKKDSSAGKGIFSGLFKFGKHRKNVEEKSDYNKENIQERPEQIHSTEQDRIREQQRILVEKQRQLEAAKYREEQHRILQQQHPQPQQQREELQDGANSPSSRAEKIQQLRQIHQMRHQQRQGVYPLDDKEEKLERHIQDYERQQRMAEEIARGSDGYYGNLPPRHRSPERPERTQSISDPERYSHYANIEEIRQQLRRHDYIQQQLRYQQQQQKTVVTARHQAHMSGQLPPSGYHESRSNIHPSSSTQSSHTHHYADPRQLRAVHNNHPHQQKSQLYSHSYGPDSKTWSQMPISQTSSGSISAGAGYQHGRSLTPGPASGPRAGSPSPSPTRPRANTPNVVGVGMYNSNSSLYHNQAPPSYHSQTAPLSLQKYPPQIVVNGQSYTQVPQTSQMQQRHYSDFDGRHIYSRERTEVGNYQHEPHFGSLPRKRDTLNSSRGSQGPPHSNLMSGSAQV